MKMHQAKDKKLLEIGEELNALQQYCNNEGLTVAEMQQVFSPIYLFLTKRKTVRKWLFFMILIFIISITYTLMAETIFWHITVITRLALIEIRPLWDWSNLKNSNCLLYGNDAPKNHRNITLNCDLCESIGNITITPSMEIVDVQRYITIDEPFIVEFQNSNPVTFNDVHADFFDSAFLASVPCDLRTNLASSRKVTVGLILRRTVIIPRWFYHFRNCQLNAIKHARFMLPNMAVLPRNLYHVHTNWMIANRKYHSKGYKFIDVASNNIIMVTSWIGGCFIQLQPKKQCDEYCDVLEFYLTENHTLVFVSSVWNLFYKTNETIEENLMTVEEMYND